MTEDLTPAIATLDAAVPEPQQGLPDAVFYYISRTTPLVNVDLWVEDASGRVLLSWRDDSLTGRGWYVPGGIVRYQETLTARIQAVAWNELGAEVVHEAAPSAVNEIIARNQRDRGHFVSLLYRCHFAVPVVIDNRGRQPGEAGFLQWHAGCPDDLLSWHEIYRPLFARIGETT